MNRRHFLQTSAAALGAPLAISTAAAAHMNFIVILMDDLGWADVGCYGSTFYETPNIDRMGARGVRFTVAYAACPLCSPSRAGIMTGKFPARVGVTNYLPGKHQLPYSKLLPPESKQFLALEEKTIPEI